MDLSSQVNSKEPVELQQVTVVTADDQHVNPGFSMESDGGPPPYYESDGINTFSNGSVFPDGSHGEKSNGSLTSPGTPKVNMSHSGTRGMPASRDSQLTVEPGNERRRHKSEGAMPGNQNLLDPNSRKSSDFGSKSTLSGVKYDDSFVDDSGVTLIYSRHETVPMKDFSKEIRANMDVKRFLQNTILLLDLNKNSLDDIIDEILHKILDSSETKESFDQARSALFTHDCVHQISRTLQCTSIAEGGGFDYDQNWVCAMASLPSIQNRHVGIARLRHPANLGMTCQEVYFVIVILTPTKEKGTKNELETGRTFATIFSDFEFRLHLLDASTEEEFKVFLEQHTNELADRQRKVAEKISVYEGEDKKGHGCRCRFMTGIYEDLKKRIPHYISDYKDGIFGPKAIQKTVSTTFFLYFACLMPSIAFGVLNSENTHGVLNVEKVLYSQLFGGLLFSIIGGTPQIVLLTTAPLALFTKIIYSISLDFGLDFPAMFACVGLWNSFFLFVYSVFDLSILMRWSTRSSEEIFALFISIAFSVDAFKNVAKNFDSHYNTPACALDTPEGGGNGTTLSSVLTTTVLPATTLMNNDTLQGLNDTLQGLNTSTDNSYYSMICERDVSLLYLVLLFGTLWIGVTLFNFTKTPYLNPAKRELLADYALPVAVLLMTIVGVLAFKDVAIGRSFNAERIGELFKIVPLHTLSIGAIFGAMGLGFCLSLLFFMDQNISAALVNAPQNKMKKGTAYHWDLLVIGVINAVLSIVAFPWVHAALPHSPLHVRALADVEERVDQGHIYQIILRVRETRLAALFSSVLIGLSLLVLPYLAYIPTPVLYGLFLYVAVTSVYGNQMFERVMLLFTEQNAYPPNHYIRHVPQRKIHLFTLLQLVQLLILCAFGFAPYPYLKMFFPVLIFCLIPVRHKVIPRVIQQKFLKAMDSH